MPGDVSALSPGGQTIYTAPPDSLLLPLLKILRLVVATPPVAEAGRKLRADLVVLLLYAPRAHAQPPLALPAPTPE